MLSTFVLRFRWPLLQLRFMSRSVLDRATWLLFSAMTISKCVALGLGNLFVCSVICYNATPLLRFVIIIELSCEVWNYCFVNYVIVRLPLIYSGVDIWINVVILQWLCNVILLGNRGWFGVPRGHPTVFLSYQEHMHSCQRSSDSDRCMWAL